MRYSEFNRQVKEASEIELENMLTRERKGLYDLRQRIALKQLDNPHAIKNARKNVARIQTEMRARQIKAEQGS